MKKLLLFFLFFFNLYNAHSLVFVHIGKKLPSHICYSVQQARLFNPDCPIYLLAEKRALSSERWTNQTNTNLVIEELPWITQCRIIPIALEDLQKTKAHQAFNARTSFRDGDGIWKSASERFLYIYDFMEQYNLQDVFHIENDVTIYVDLGTLIPALHQEYQTIAGVFDSDYRCVPGFIFFNDIAHMKTMAEFFVQQANQHKNDMQVIGMFKNAYPTLIKELPIIMDEYIQKRGLNNSMNQVPKTPYKYSQHLHAFNGIFDGAALGQYLGGIDPIHGHTKPGFINETCVFNPSHLTYEWRKDERGRRIPYAIFEGHAYRINNLHIHSKKLENFISW